MGVYLQTGNSLQNAYIGEYVGPREPWANTLAYFPLSSNTIDQTGNATIGWNWVQDWLGFRPSWAGSTSALGSPCCYTNFRINIKDYSWAYVGMGTSVPVTWNFAVPGYYIKHADGDNFNRRFFIWTESTLWPTATSYWSPATWTWHNISWWWDWTKCIISVDGSVSTLYNQSTWWSLSDNRFWYDAWNYIISKLVLEDTVRGDSKILDYYNQTKADYWIS